MNLKRPPNSESLGFIVTTGSLEIEETWDPASGPLEIGAVLKRTIVQRATELTGIALKAAPGPAIEVIRTYLGNPEVFDKTERGEFLGERRETITYLVQEPGLHALPEIRYNWWNRITETMESRSLSPVTFTATAPPTPPKKTSPFHYLWLVPITVFLSLVVHGREYITNGLHRFHEWIDPPSRRTARNFIKACRRNDPAEAALAWSHDRSLYPGIPLSADLQKRIQQLYSHLYGPEKTGVAWSGQVHIYVFLQSRQKQGSPSHPSRLPNLNP